jgi:hypothetical protein
MYAIRCKNCGHQETPHCFEKIREATNLEHPNNPVCDEYEMDEEGQKLHNQYAKEEEEEKMALAGRRYYLLTPHGVFELEG